MTALDIAAAQYRCAGLGTLDPCRRGGASRRLGSPLFVAALQTAEDRGLPNVEAEMLGENLPMLGLMRSRPYAVIAFAEGRVRVVVRAGKGAPTWAPKDDGPG